MNTIFTLYRRDSEAVIYYCGLSLAIITSLAGISLWDFPLLFDAFKLISFIFLLYRGIVVFSQLKPGQLLLAILCLIIVLIVGLKSESTIGKFLTYLIILGARGLYFRDVIKVHFVTSALFCICTIVGCCIGLIPNEIADMRARESLGDLSIGVRMGLGYGWPTDCATHVLFILLSYWYIKYRKLNLIEIILYSIIIGGIAVYTDGRLTTILSIILVLYSIVLKFRRKESQLSSFMAFFLMICIPFFCVISIIATYCFNSSNEIWFILDVLLSGRLHLGQDALISKGIPLCGQVYKLYGGFDSPELYNYIDNSYVQCAVISGLIYTILVVLIFYIICKKGAKRHDKSLLFSIFIAGMAGVMIQFFANFSINPFMLALITIHTQDKLQNKSL